MIDIPTGVACQSKLSQKRFDQILESLRAGNSRTVAARAGGTTDRSLRRWTERFPELRDQVEAAEDEAERAHVSTVVEAAKSDWRAAGWWLERRRGEHWGRIDRVALFQLERQAEQLSEELRAEGIEVTAAELLREREALVKRSTKALPAPAADHEVDQA